MTSPIESTLDGEVRYIVTRASSTDTRKKQPVKNEDPKDLGEVEKEALNEEYDENVLSLPFETAKHLTTLTAGSIVLIGTFLKDIFPRDPQTDTLSLSDFSTMLVGAAFILFAFSLLTASYFMILFYRAPDLAALRKQSLRTWIGNWSLAFYIVSFLPFVFGQGAFAWAVLREVVWT